MGDLLRHRAADEPEVGEPLGADHLDAGLDALLLLLVQLIDGGVQYARIERSAQTAHAGQNHQRRPLLRFRHGHQRMLEVAHRTGDAGCQLSELVGVGTPRDRGVVRFLETRGGDQLHGPRDLADVADRLAALDQDSAIRHVEPSTPRRPRSPSGTC